MEEQKIAYVILHFGNCEITKRALESLKSSDEGVYLVLNGSNEEEEVYLKNEFNRVNFLSLKENYGFAGGMNRGITRALHDGYEYIVISNNDVIFDEKFCEVAKSIFKEVKGDKICFSPLIFDEEGKIWFSSGKFSYISGRAKHKDFSTKNFPKDKIESDYLTGCCLLFSKDAVKDVGLMDESYFLYWEDVDWSFRLKKMGYKFFIFPELKIVHLGSKSTQLESEVYLYYFFRNHLKFLVKNISCFLLPVISVFFSINLIKLFLVWSLFYGREGKRKIKAVLKGLSHFFMNKEGATLK